MRTGFEGAAELLPERLRAAALMIPARAACGINELRLRAGRAFSAVTAGRECYITAGGGLTSSPEGALRVSAEDAAFAFRTAFRGSVHAFPRELAEGFITCGGNRVGFCGSAVPDGKEGLSSVKDISSVNIRIAAQITGCAEELCGRAFAGGICSVIIASPPCGGKTTVLRDLCRLLGREHRLSLIDERSEIAAVSGGVPQNDVGERTDVFTGCPRAEAVMTAVRVMSPEVIVCDEIGSPADLKALSYAVDSGASLVCTCHARSFEGLKKRPAAGELIGAGVFRYAVLLGTGSRCGSIEGFYDLADCGVFV